MGLGDVFSDHRAPNPGEEITISLSVPFTRRKQYHYATGENGRFLYRTMNSAELFDWLGHHDVKEYFVESQLFRYRVAVLSSSAIKE